MQTSEKPKKIFDKEILYLPLNIIFLISFILSISFLNSVISDSSEIPMEKEEFFDKYYYFTNETNIIIANESNNLKDINKKECYHIQSLIVSNNQSLVSIFELKTDTIHNLSIALKAFDIIMLICVIIMFFSFPFPQENADKKDCCNSFCAKLMCLICFNCIYIPSLVLYILSFIVQLILFSILCGKYNNSDIYNFLNFLECDNINKEAFEEYSIFNDYSYHIVLLKVFHSFYIVYCFAFVPLTHYIFQLDSKVKTKDIKDKKDEINDNDKTQIIMDN